MLKCRYLLATTAVVLAVSASVAKASPFGFVFGASPNPVFDGGTNEFAYTYNLTLSFDSTGAANAGGYEEMLPGQTITVPNFFGYTGVPTVATLVGLSGPGTAGTFSVAVAANLLTITDLTTAEAGPTTSTVSGNSGTISTLKWAFTIESVFGQSITTSPYTGNYTTKASSSSSDAITTAVNTGTVKVPTPPGAGAPEPWNFVSALATFVPVGMLYFGLRRRKQASQLVARA